MPIPIFASQMKSGKNACSADLHMVFIHEVGFVWRQLGLAFFGAVTPVAALFVYKKGLTKYEDGTRNERFFRTI